jgi:hypothetical protein
LLREMRMVSRLRLISLMHIQLGSSLVVEGFYAARFTHTMHGLLLMSVDNIYA